MFSCLSRLMSIGLLVAVGLVAWTKRDALLEYLNARLGTGDAMIEAAQAAQSVDLAKQVENKVIALGRGEESEISLSTEELNAWITEGLKGYFPKYLHDVTTSISDDHRLVLNGLITVKDIPGLGDYAMVSRLVGDTTSVEMIGRLDGIEPGRGLYFVDRASMGPIPMPESFRNLIIAHFMGEAPEDVPDGAVAFPLPDFVTDVGVREGAVQLRGCRGGGC